MNSKTRKLVLSAMLAALCCIATMIIKIPSPLKGYINLGDCFVLICGWLLVPPYGALAAGIGSMLADVFSPYVIYAPITLVIKGMMTLIVFFADRMLGDKIGKLSARLTGSIMAEVFMIFGYFMFEGYMYGFVTSAANIPVNAVQGVAGLILGILIMNTFDKYDITKKFFDR